MTQELDKFILFLKTALEKQHRDFLDNRIATGNVGKDGYEKAIGILEALRATQQNLDVWYLDFKKSGGQSND